MENSKNDKTKRLEKVKEFLDKFAGMKTEEFIKHFRIILDFVKGIEKANREVKRLLVKEFFDLSKALKDTINSDLSGIKSKIDKALKDQQNGMNFIYDKVRGLKHGIDGKDADEKKIVQDVLAQIKLPEQKEIILDTPEQIRDKLETLEENERLEIKAIKDLREELDELKARPIGGRGGGGFSALAMNYHFVDDEEPTGTINGVNTDFVISHTPSPASSLKVYVNGQKMRLTTDYTFTTRTITFLTAPPEGSIIHCDYRI